MCVCARAIMRIRKSEIEREQEKDSHEGWWNIADPFFAFLIILYCTRYTPPFRTFSSLLPPSSPPPIPPRIFSFSFYNIAPRRSLRHDNERSLVSRYGAPLSRGISTCTRKRTLQLHTYMQDVPKLSQLSQGSCSLSDN